MLYNNLSSYLKKKYGSKVRKICIDGGFSCPNRDGRCGVGGCILCGERGAGEHIDAASGIRAQTEAALARGKSEKYIAYFQNFTNTYADLATLKERYDSALIDSRITALAIGTRPDCIDEEIAALIASYNSRLDVWVELGLQTASDKTAKIINRGYGRDTFERAVSILDKHGIPVVVHLIAGLLGETLDDVKATADYISRFKLFGIKIHSLYVMDGTRLSDMYRGGEYSPISEDEYIESVLYILTHISSDTVIHRLTGDCPEGLLLAPEWSLDKTHVLERIRKELEVRGLYQGIYYDGGLPT